MKSFKTQNYRYKFLVLSLVLCGASTGCRSRESTGELEEVTLSAIAYKTIRIPMIHRGNRAAVTEILQNISSGGFDILGRDVESGEIDLSYRQDPRGVLNKLVKEGKIEIVEAPKNSVTKLNLATPEVGRFPECDVSTARQQQTAGFVPDSRYWNLGKLYKRLVELFDRDKGTHRDIGLLMTLGKSADGTEIYAVKITKNPRENHPERPAVYFNSLHHARELMTVEVTMDMLDTLVESYENNLETRFWVDNTTIFVVPMINPSGNYKVWNGDAAWRKNFHRNGAPDTDINRNYPYDWGKCGGGQIDPQQDTFLGTGPASEPETQAVLAFVKKYRPVMSLSYHSFSEIVLYPYGCYGKSSPYRWFLGKLAAEIAESVPRDCRQGHYASGESWELLYPTDGDDYSELYANHDVMAFLMEINSREQYFQPDYTQWRDRTVHKVRASWQTVLRMLWRGVVFGFVVDSDGKAIENATVTIDNGVAEGRAYSASRPTNADGAFFMIAPPGTYSVRVRADQRNSASTTFKKVDCVFPQICAVGLGTTLHSENSGKLSTIEVNYDRSAERKK